MMWSPLLSLSVFSAENGEGLGEIELPISEPKQVNIPQNLNNR
jgi:hypothetical protein